MVRCKMNTYKIELTNGKSVLFKMLKEVRLFALLRDPATQLIWNHDHTSYIMKSAVVSFSVIEEVETTEELIIDNINF